MAFSCIIPALHIICWVALLLLYFSDKLLVMRHYQTPPNHTPDIHYLLRRALYFSIIVHMALSAVFLSEPQLIAVNSSLSDQYRLVTGNKRIDAMLNTSYIIPYVVTFILLIGWTLFDNTIITLCSKCSTLCRNKRTQNPITKQKLDQTYYQSINRYQLNKLKRITENELDKIVVKNQKYMIEMANMPPPDPEDSSRDIVSRSRYIT